MCTARTRWSCCRPPTTDSVADLDEDAVVEVFGVMRDRVAKQLADGHVHAHTFVNHGRPAGASIEHPHAQVVALDFIPPFTNHMLERFERTQRDLVRDAIDEARNGPYVIVDDEIVTWSPPASTASYTVRCALPFGRQRFDLAADREIRAVALGVKDVLRRLRAVLGDVPYNVVVHTAPGADERPFHWWIDIVPRLSVTAGFEHATGSGGLHRRPRSRVGGARSGRVTVEVGITIDAPVARVWQVIEPIEHHVDWMTDAVSITFTTAQRRGVGTEFECVTKIGPFRTIDRMIVTEWEPEQAMGIEHRGLFTGTGRFTLRVGGARTNAVHVDRTHPVPMVVRRPGGCACGPSRCCVGSGQGTCAVSPRSRDPPRSIPPHDRSPHDRSPMTDHAVSVAGLQTLGATMSLDVARESDALGFGSIWVAEANAAESMGLLGAISQVAPSSGLGTGVLALQLRTPPLHAMAAATLQQLAAERDVFLGVGISSPAVAGQWHGARYSDRPLAQVREFIALLRECLSGETVSFAGDFYNVSRFRLGIRLGERKPRIVLAALNEQMLRLAGEIADGVLLNYLPATLVPWCVEQVRKGGDADIYAYVHCAVTDRDRYAEAARKDLLNYAVVDAYAKQFARAGFADDVAEFRERRQAKDRDGALAAIGDAWVDGIQIMGDAAHVQRVVQAYCDNGVDTPIVFALPWGEDRRATVSATLRALV